MEEEDGHAGPQGQALSRISVLRNIIDTAPSYLDLEEIKKSFNEANEAYQQAQYEDASIIASLATKSLMDLRQRYMATLQEIKDAEAAVASGEASHPQRAKSSEPRILRAKQVLMDGRFDMAIEIAGSVIEIMENGTLDFDPLEDDAEESLEEAEKQLRGLPAMMVGPELKLLLQQARSSLQARDFYETLETVHLMKQRTSQLIKDAGSLIEDLVLLEKQFKSDLVKGHLSQPLVIQGMIHEIRTALSQENIDPARYHIQRCRRELEVQREYVLGPLRQKAIATMSPLAQIIAQEKEEGVDTTDAEDLLDDARAEMEAAATRECYEKVIQLATSADNALKRAEARFQRVSHEVEEAENLMGTVEETISKLAGYVRISPDIESLVSKLKECLEPSQIKGFKAKYSQLSEAVTKIQHDSHPQLSIETKLESHHPKEWMKAVMVLSNTGDASASDISISIGGPLEVHRIEPIASLPYDQKTVMEIGVKFLDEGNVPFDVHLEFSRSLDGKKSSHDIEGWMTIGESVPTLITPPIQVGTHGQVVAPEEEPEDDLSPEEDLFEFELDDDDDTSPVEVEKVIEVVSEEDIIEKIGRLGELVEKGLLTKEEFQEKKKELLARL